MVPIKNIPEHSNIYLAWRHAICAKAGSTKAGIGIHIEEENEVQISLCQQLANMSAPHYKQSLYMALQIAAGIISKFECKHDIF